jgi:hypothetical protein
MLPAFVSQTINFGVTRIVSVFNQHIDTSCNWCVKAKCFTSNDYSVYIAFSYLLISNVMINCLQIFCNVMINCLHIFCNVMINCLHIFYNRSHWSSVFAGILSVLSCTTQS